jgi:outer membrane PBP1 activator LpoA protein
MESGVFFLIMKTSLLTTIKLCLIGALGFLLFSCANMQSASVSLRNPFTQSPDYYLQQANANQGQERANYQLQASAAYFYYGDFDQGRATLYKIERQTLNPLNSAQYDLLSARLALYDKQARRTLQILDSLINNPEMTPQLQVEALKLRASAQEALQLPVDSIKTRILITPLLTEQSDKDANERDIWQAMNTLPTEQLHTMSQDSSDPTLQGWASLAFIVRQNGNQPQVLLQQLKNWQTQFANHPAFNLVSTDLSHFDEWMKAPTKVALLLPLKGNLAPQAQAVMNGFMAAYYQAQQHGMPRATIKFYDTSTDNIVTIYKQALADGAQFVLGPLTKQNVSKLASDADIDVPTLALNFSEDSSLPKHYYEFALSPKVEAQRIADKATQLGYINAITISPKGQWGDDIRQAFSRRWLNDGGKIVSNLSYENNDNLKYQISDLLNINQSYLREKALKKIIGQNLKFSPRKRNDIDMIFLNAQAQDARQILPLLRFYYAGNTPVYATSQIYNGMPNPSKDTDLNKVRFTIMPWAINPSPDAVLIRQHLSHLWPDSFKKYSLLYAFGTDAYNLMSHMGQLSAFPKFGFPGNTGTLFVGKDQRIQRNTEWAEFEDGKPKLIKFDNNVIVPLNTDAS